MVSVFLGSGVGGGNSIKRKKKIKNLELKLNAEYQQICNFISVGILNPCEVFEPFKVYFIFT